VTYTPFPLSTFVGLAALNLFAAAAQTGFGPFLPVYLTQAGWSHGAVGIALSVGAIASVVSQVPAGLLVDQVPHKRLLCAVSLGVIGLSAFSLAVSADVPLVWGAKILHAFAAAVLAPGIAALTLALSGHRQFGERVGNNGRYASLGNAVAAALLGLFAYHLSDRAVFFLAAAMSIPAIASLLLIQPALIGYHRDHLALLRPRERTALRRQLFLDKRMHIFAVCIVLFTFANAAMLPVSLSALVARHGRAGLAATGSTIALQAVVVLIAPWIGRAADRWGRRPLLVAGFAALPLRGLLLAAEPNAESLIAIEMLDGASAAVMGVLIPLVAADLTRKSGFLNLAIGSFGLAGAIGAAFSTTLAGWIADLLGLRAAFFALAAIGGIALVFTSLLMPETRADEIGLEVRPDMNLA
jgi:MFS family permease